MSEQPQIRTVEIPFTYSVHYKARTWTNERSVKFAATVTVPFRSVDAGAAPVAMRLACTSKASYGRNPFRPKEDGAPREVRWFEDGFWIESKPLDEMAAGLTAKAVNDTTPFAEVVDVMAFHAGPTVYGKKDRWGTPKPPDTPSGVQTAESLNAFEHGIRYITDDGGASDAEDILAAAGRCIVIDGTVYENIPEPCLTLSSYGDGIFIAFNPDANRTTHIFHTLSNSGFHPISEMGAAVAAVDANDRGSKRPLPHVEILRPDLAFDTPESNPCMKSAQALARTLVGVASKLPRDWIGPAAALVNALAGKPRHPTPAVAAALESIAALSEPQGEDLRRFLRLAQRADRRTEDVIKAMGESLVAAAKLAPLARRLSDANEREGRMSASTVSLFKVEDSMFPRRLRQARSREDVRRAARLMGEPVLDLEARMERDADVDIVLFETGSHNPEPGDDMKLVGVAEVDLSSGEIVSLIGDEIPTERLQAHLEKAWPGNGPDASYATPGPR